MFIIQSDHDTNKASKIFTISFAALLLMLIPVVLFAIYYHQYEDGGYKTIAKITLKDCTAGVDKECEYLGAVTKRPFLDDIKVKTTPKYPILICTKYIECKQEVLFINKNQIETIVDVNSGEKIILR